MVPIVCITKARRITGSQCILKKVSTDKRAFDADHLRFPTAAQTAANRRLFAEIEMVQFFLPDGFGPRN